MFIGFYDFVFIKMKINVWLEWNIFFDLLLIRLFVYYWDLKNIFMKCVKIFKELIIIFGICMYLKLNIVYLIMKEKYCVKRGRVLFFLKIFKIFGNNF